MFHKLLLLSLAFSGHVVASEEITFKIQCAEVIKMLDGINEHVSENKIIELESCEETHDTVLFGAIKKNFKSKLSLSSANGLCTDAKYVEKETTLLGNGVDLGIDYRRKLKVLEAYGLMSGDIRSSGGLEGIYLTGLHYPVCD